MLVRNLLLALGILALVAGIALTAIWFTSQPTRRPVTEVKAPPVARSATLVAARPISSGTLLRAEDIASREVERSDIQPGQILAGQELEILGAVSRRDLVAGEPLVAGDFVKPSERGFLAAVLKPGTRAVTITVDASQSASGLIQPGDRVDLILVQSVGDQAEASRKDVVAETVLVDLRAIAIDQSLGGAIKSAPAVATERRAGILEAQLPKTVTLEVTPPQAQVLLVAGQLGHLGISLRALAGPAPAEAAGAIRPTWSWDVSPSRSFSTGSTIEKSIRYAPPRETTIRAPIAAETTSRAPAAAEGVIR